MRGRKSWKAFLPRLCLFIWLGMPNFEIGDFVATMRSCTISVLVKVCMMSDLDKKEKLMRMSAAQLTLVFMILGPSTTADETDGFFVERC